MSIYRTPAAARVVLADPPWLFGDALPGSTRGAAKRYTCLPTEQIARLQLPPITHVAALVMWRVSSMPMDAFQVIDAWGFQPKSEVVWRKVHPCKTKDCGYDVDSPEPSDDGDCPRCGAQLARWFGMGRYVRAEHETAIIATRGTSATKLVRSHSVRSTFMAPADRSETGHSKKPAAMRTLVEQLFEGPYVELFARREVDGWATYGDEVGRPLHVGPARKGNQLLLGGAR